MARFNTDFSDYALGDAPSDWTNLPSPYEGDATWEVVSSEGDLGGAVLTGHADTDPWTSGHHVLTWDLPGTSEDTELLAKIKCNGDNWQQQVLARIDKTALDYYMVVMRDAGFNVTVSNAGTHTHLAENIFGAPTVGVWYWVRFSLAGTALRVRIWADGDTEPASWTWEGTDSSHTSGYVGLGFWLYSPLKEYDYFSVGTAGDSALTYEEATAAMPTVIDRVRETTATTGTGTLTLGGAEAGFRGFSVAGEGTSCYYAMADGTDWEVGVGIYSSGTLSRDTVLSSSNSGSLVNWGAGTKVVWSDAPASLINSFLIASNNLSDLADAATARDNLDLFSRTELTKAIGTITHPLTDLDLQSAAGVRASKFAGDFQFLRESAATYVDRYGVLHKTSYYSGTPTSTGSNSITDTGLSLTRTELVDYVVYLTDGSAEAYRWVSANSTTQVFWNSPIDFTPTSYKISQPRFEADGMLTEGESTNLLTYSEDFSNAAWIKTSVTVNSADDLTVNGVTLHKIVNASGVNFAYVTQSLGSVSDGETVTASFYIYEGTSAETALRLSDETGTNRTTVPITWAGGIPSQGNQQTDGWTYVDSGIELIGNGVYRAQVTVTNGTGGALTVITRYYEQWTNGSGASEYAYAGFAQGEKLPFASSYIPTTSAAVTRAADVLSVASSENMPGANYSFSVIADYDVFGYWANYARIFDVSGGRRLHASDTDSTSLYGYDGATSVIAGDQDTNTVIRAGYSSDTSNQYIYADGVTQSTASYAAPTESGDLYIGCDSTGARQLYGHIPKFRIYDRALTDTEMRVA